jgi:CubicO group peptidase (beta-lactamase class C family)
MLLNAGQWNGVGILTPETVREMTRNQIGDLTFMWPPNDRFGYGFAIVATASKDQPTSVGSYSWGGFYNTYFWVDPQKKLVGVLMTQIVPSDHLTLLRDFNKLAYAAIQPLD